MGTKAAVDIHAVVEAAFNAGDLDGLMALYEPEACMAGMGGDVARGSDAVREAWTGVLAMGGTMTLTTDFVLEVGDLALLRNTWTVRNGDMEMSASTAEVARRQLDGTWLYVIDHPFGASAVIP